MRNKLASNSFIIFSVIYLLLILFGREDIAWFIKPSLQLFLVWLVYTFEDFPTKKILLAALAFSWIGAINEMFNGNPKLTFILGICIFLATHIFYIILFTKQPKTEKFRFSFIFLIGIGVVLIHLLVMLSLLLPNLGNSKIPVIIYAFTLSTMLISAFKGSLHWENPANMNILLGAFIFAFSDSINALNLFYTDIPKASFWIEFSYLAAQFLIVSGILCLNKQKTASSLNKYAV